ncbi:MULTISPECIES: mannitol dehydrogenase family protein [unclassified Sphingomonas]|uniref:mannitol dehydrogenase family protein n=1 Tax=unclassified Sphingomonas TaxID=196159 RepID=UPI001F415C35|nr:MULTISPECIES: mannitol dehydrogenase family protein [unclassified Sphingomonas]
MSASTLADGIALPGYTRDRARSGIVHLGLGAFHRAHQAVFTDDAMAAGDAGWGIIGVSLRSPAVRDALEPQDCLYVVEERGEGGRSRLIGSINQALVAPEDPDRVIAALADPGVHVVTLTVTEKGYHRDPGSNHLLVDAQDVVHDLAGGAPRTIFGYLAAALDRRCASGAGPLTILSCDNLPDNGRLLGGLLDDYLVARGRARPAGWACPNSMVDRIVPATTAGDRARLTVEDHGLTICETFRQWVIEDRFAGPRPRWEAGGAQIVDDVRPFELAKLRLLNGAHSALAYWGLALGHAHVHEAVRDAELLVFVRHQLLAEAVPTLPPSSALDPEAYVAAILRRFDNPALPHRLAQIAMDGSQKLPQRWLATIVERDAKGLNSPAHLASLAAWIAFVGDRSGPGRPADDPLAPRLEAIWDGHSTPGEIAMAVARTSGVFPAAFGASDALCRQLGEALDGLTARGRRGALEAFLSTI